MSENTGLGILVHCTSRGRRGTLEPVMRYFVAGAGLGRFRSLIPCACHATDSHTQSTHSQHDSQKKTWRGAPFVRLSQVALTMDIA